MSNTTASHTTFPDTAPGRTAAAFMRILALSADDVVFEDLDVLYHPDLLARWPREDDQTRRQWWRRNQSRGGFRIVEVQTPSETAVAPVIEYANGRRFKISLTFEDAPPHRITDERWEQIHDFELVLREAVDDDAAALADLERRSPVVVGDASVTFDRGGDYFASARLMEDATVIVAEVDGEPAGVAWGAAHRATVAGEERRLWYFFHLRVLPEHQRKGLWGALADQLWSAYADRADFSYGLFQPDNVAWRAAGMSPEENPGVWRGEHIVRVFLDTAVLAGPPFGRPATEADAEHMVGILNTCHGREEMYQPYTVGSLASRVSRDPTLYSWDKLLLTDRAVVGVWPAGVRVTTTSDDPSVVARRAYVLDYGFVPGGEDDLEGLLRAWSTSVAGLGMDELSIFTSVWSSAYPILRSLAKETEVLRITMGPRIPEPDDVGERGMYVDHVYF